MALETGDSSRMISSFMETISSTRKMLVVVALGGRRPGNAGDGIGGWKGWRWGPSGGGLPAYLLDRLNAFMRAIFACNTLFNNCIRLLINLSLLFLLLNIIFKLGYV